MLQASRLQPKLGTTDTSIAGRTSGKRILCSQQALPIYNDLVKLAKNGNHWAGLIVRGIEGLTSGRLDKGNIYIDKRKSLAYGKDSFYVVLPGVTATLDDHPNGSYILQHIKVDGNYQKLQNNSQKPGLWRVHSETDQAPTFQSDSKILKKDIRPVVISDMVNDDIGTVAVGIRKGLTQKDPTLTTLVNQTGFDMHFTPGDSLIVGLKKAQSALATSKEREITQSAILLANTMYKARQQQGVIWYSDWGGSAILTRAMQILHEEKDISLEHHGIFLNRPTTRPKEAIDIADKLGIVPHGKGKDAGGKLKEFIGHIDITDVSASGLWESTKFATGAVGAAATFAGLAGAIPAAAGAAGAMFFVGTTIKAASKKLTGMNYK